MSALDLLIVGAGPGGMSAALAARRAGLSVMVVDEQPSPGGQIWRSIELAGQRDAILGKAYSEGRPVAARFRSAGVDYEPDAQIWLIERGFKVYLTRGGKAQAIHARSIILATGAQERPAPFPGWTLPGVLTVGAAQILLKSSGQVPAGPVWIAGSGPLPLLYANQLLKAGGKLAGYLDTTPSGRMLSAIPHAARALGASGDILKGLGWMAALRLNGVRTVRRTSHLEALGDGEVERIRFRSEGGKWSVEEASTLLIHEGVVPNIHVALSLGCEVTWNEAQTSFEPVLDEWGETTIPGVFVAGDGAGIAGAKAALLRGELAGIGVAAKLGRVVDDREAARLRRGLRRELAARPLLDALFTVRRQVTAPADDTIVCRCEEVTAGEIRSLGAIGQPGPNQVKAASRAGMGPCQGRQCGYTITRLLAEVQHRAPSEVGFFNIRAPLKPVTLGELASLATGVAPGPSTEASVSLHEGSAERGGNER